MSLRSPLQAQCAVRQAIRRGSQPSYSAPRRCHMLSPRRHFSAAPIARDDQPIREADQPAADEAPRWSETPSRMKGPFPLSIAKVRSRSLWKVNSDPAKLDQMYIRLLGRDGARLLPDEIRWLAITHKSFDQGRRGFNDRLAFFGRQAFVLEVARSIVFSPAREGAIVADQHGRTPFDNSSLASLDNFNATLPHNLVSVEKLARFAVDVGLDKVLRWKPRMPEDLQASGVNLVLNGAVYAIVGAISLQHGAEVAGRVIRERIIARLDASPVPLS